MYDFSDLRKKSCYKLFLFEFSYKLFVPFFIKSLNFTKKHLQASPILYLVFVIIILYKFKRIELQVLTGAVIKGSQFSFNVNIPDS